MNFASLLVFAGEVPTYCDKVPLPRSIISGTTITPTPNTTSFKCTTFLEQPSMWVVFSPLLALVAALYIILATIGDYLEFKDKNLKEHSSQPEYENLDARAKVRKSKIRGGQQLQVTAKVTSALATCAAVSASYYYRGSLSDSQLTFGDNAFINLAWITAAVTVVTIAAVLWFIGRGRNQRINEAGKSSSVDKAALALTQPEPAVLPTATASKNNPEETSETRSAHHTCRGLTLPPLHVCRH